MSITIAFRFPAGRYHATPWGRHVNEAEVEWPPSPWRILRAFVAVWHRKIDSTAFPEATLDRLVERLAGVRPGYHLPRASRFHTRHYMPTGNLLKGGRENTTLIFDAFVRLDPEDELIVSWPNVLLEPAERELLGTLLERLGYLGRAESWVEARVLDSWDGEFNCFASDLSVNPRTGEELEPMSLAVPMIPGAYTRWRAGMLDEFGLEKKKLNKGEQELLATLPELSLDTLRLETAAVQRQGWSRMPGLEYVIYQRPHDAFTPQPRLQVRTRERTVTAVRLLLTGKPLPRLEDAVRIGELVRVAAIFHADRLANGGPISSVLSGHDLPEDASHGHAFYLPEDADGDGRIDHVLIFARNGLGRAAVAALGKITRLWQQDGGEWGVILESFAERVDSVGSMYAGRGHNWRSVTPYLHPWYAKRGFGVREQIARECRARKLPEPKVIRVMPVVEVRGRELRPIHFHRFRSKRGLRQPDTKGSLLELVFDEPIEGPLALGFGCHYGLGIFRPY